jgi:CheY-like chemotaxis protein
VKVLLVEDDENKRLRLLSVLQSIGSEVVCAASYQGALRALLLAGYDAIVLDMTLPTFDISEEDDGGRPQALGGQELLRQMKRRRIGSPVIVVTQFDQFGERRDALTRQQLDAELRTHHRDIYAGLVFYDSTTEGWKEQLVVLLSEALAGRDKDGTKNINS